MIQPNDLRIGNFITDGTLQVLRVNTVYPRCVGVDGRVSYHYPDQIEGIPLTPEILEKAEFVRDDKYSPFDPHSFLRKRYNNVSFESDDSVDFKTVFVYVRGHEISTVTYVHQLQNLYYALTGGELEINFNEAT